MKPIIDRILDGIEIMIDEKLRKIRFNYYIEASVDAVNVDGTCNIQYRDQVLSNIKVREGLTLTTNDIVLVCIVNGDFSNKFIDLKRP